MNHIECAIATLGALDVALQLELANKLELARNVGGPEELYLVVPTIIEQSRHEVDQIYRRYRARLQVFDMLEQPSLLVSVSE
jgi:hypothetical protein